MSRIAAPHPNRRWYAVQCQPRREKLAITHLARQGFASRCPARLRLRKAGRRTTQVEAPLFPGYVFVSLDLENERWRSINGTTGVVRLVSFGSGGRPAPLPAGLVERLSEMSGLEDDGEALQPGDRVRVIGGPLDDLCGLLETAGDNERVTILLTLLGQQTRVSLNRGALIAA
jgi:transcriptional antiterminator RfaH